MNHQKTKKIVSDNLTNFIANIYKIEIRDCFSRVQAGYSSDNFIIGSQDKKYFLKRYNKKCDQTRICDIHKTKEFFAANGIPIARPLITKKGESFFKFGGRFYALFPYLGQKTNQKSSIEMIRSLAEMQAKMHQVGKPGRPKIHQRKLTTWNKNSAKDRGQAILKIIENRQRLDRFDKSAKEFVEFKIEQINKNEITPQKVKLSFDHLVHGDFHGHNVFYDQSGRVKNVFDLEKTVYAPRAYELSRAIDYVCLSDFDIVKAGIYFGSYRKIYPISDEEFFRGFRFYFLKGIHTFWIEESHYFENDRRADELYVGDIKRTRYFEKNLDRLLAKIIEQSKR